MGERHDRYVWYDGSSKQSGGGQASISQRHLGSDVLTRICRRKQRNELINDVYSLINNTRYVLAETSIFFGRNVLNFMEVSAKKYGRHGSWPKCSGTLQTGQIILSGILPVFGNRIQGYRNSKRMAVNGMVKQICKEEEVGYVDLWDSFQFVGKEEM